MDDIRRFIVVGEHSSPEDFENYVLIQLLKREPLEFNAAQEERITEPKPFVFRTLETHHDPNFWINALDKAGNWIRIDAVDNKVFFDLYPGVA